MRSTLIITLGVALAAGSVLAATDFDQLDADGDRKLSQEELAGSGVFQRWDANGDRELSEDELAANREAIDRSLAQAPAPAQAPVHEQGDDWPAQGGGQAEGAGVIEGPQQAGMSRDQYYGTIVSNYDRDGDSRLDADEWPEGGIWE